MAQLLESLCAYRPTCVTIMPPHRPGRVVMQPCAQYVPCMPPQTAPAVFGTRSATVAVVVGAAVPVLQSRCSFVCAPPLLREAVTEAETVTGRALELADAAQEVFLSQPLLTNVAVHADDSSAGIGGQEVGGVLMLTLVEPDRRVKVQVALRLSSILAHAHPGETQLAVQCNTPRCNTVQ